MTTSTETHFTAADLRDPTREEARHFVLEQAAESALPSADEVAAAVDAAVAFLPGARRDVVEGFVTAAVAVQGSAEHFADLAPLGEAAMTRALVAAFATMHTARAGNAAAQPRSA